MVLLLRLLLRLMVMMRGLSGTAATMHLSTSRTHIPMVSGHEIW